jgi:two-component system sensor histidine kinase BaeS
MARMFGAGDHGARVPDLGRPELVELTEALNAAAEEVDRSEQARRRLTDDIAHELRNPLTALRAGLEELRDGLVEPDAATLAALHDQATRLGRVVDDLAQLSAAESPGLQLSIENVDLGRLVELAVSAREGSARGAGLVLEQDIEPGVVVTADADRLHQAVGNVLANAVLYCRPGDTVLVRVRADAGRGTVEVADTGPGLGPEDLAHAFDRTRRGETAVGTEGSGLGLAIVRALVVAQGGGVSLDAPASGGTVVRVELPLAAPSPDAPTGPPPEGRADRGGVRDPTPPERSRGRPA